MSMFTLDTPSMQDLAARMGVEQHDVDFLDVVNDEDYRASNQWHADRDDMIAGYDIGFEDPMIVLIALEDEAELDGGYTAEDFANAALRDEWRAA